MTDRYTVTASTEAEHWHNRAQEQRVKAELMKNQHCRDSFMAMAERSELFARLAEERGTQDWQIKYNNSMELERFMLDMYIHQVRWIVLNRAGAGGWPPRDVMKVSGWQNVRMIAETHGRKVNEVARDVIAYDLTIDE